MDERDYKAMNKELSQPSCLGAVSKRYICECGKRQTVQEMREEIGEGYTQYCCKGCGDVLIDDIKGVVYCNVC